MPISATRFRQQAKDGGCNGGDLCGITVAVDGNPGPRCRTRDEGREDYHARWCRQSAQITVRERILLVRHAEGAGTRDGQVGQTHGKQLYTRHERRYFPSCESHKLGVHDRTLVFGMIFGFTFPLYFFDHQNSTAVLANWLGARLQVDADLVARLLFAFAALLLIVAAFTVAVFISLETPVDPAQFLHLGS